MRKRPPSPPPPKPSNDVVPRRYDTAGLQSALARYERGLAKLSLLAGDEYEENVWEVLIARDAVATALAGGADVSAAAFKRTADLDERLNENTGTIRNAVGANKLAAWRDVKVPPEGAWWWFLDQRMARKETEAEEKRLKYKAIWILLTFFFATVSVSFLAEITRRFFLGEGGWDSVLGTALQMPLNVVGAMLGLLTAGTMTEPVRHGVQGLLSRAGLFNRGGTMRRFVFALAFCCLVFPIWLSLPFFAHYYNDRGGSQVRAGRLSEALESYERAIKLKPEYAEAHYNLGDAYERFYKCKEAIPHYEAAIRLDNTFTHAQNNLARLYLKCGSDEQSAAALAILDQQLRQEPPPDDDVRYSLLKNQGWAKYKLKDYVGAESDLKRAIAVREEGGSAHCLLASSLDAQGQPEEATKEWIKCFENSSDQDVEPAWAEEARRRYERSMVHD